MDNSSWLHLAGICILGAMSPGPSLALILNNSILYGKFYGFATSLGHGLGIGFWAFLTAIGITELILANNTVLLVIQSLGAVLVGYIGVRTFVSGNDIYIKKPKTLLSESGRLIRGYGEGLLIALLNPKIAIFFLAIFTHFVHVDSGWTEIWLMGTIAASIDAFWYIFVTLTLTGTTLVNILERNKAIINRVIGSLLIIIALYFLGSLIQELS